VFTVAGVVASSPHDFDAKGPFSRWQRRVDGQQGRGDLRRCFRREEEHKSSKGARGRSGGFNVEAQKRKEVSVARPCLGGKGRKGGLIGSLGRVGFEEGIKP
jgi:hypothetical protein